MPLAGARQGPRQFVLGLGAGATSLIQHVSHGALTSVSDFATAMASSIVPDQASGDPAAITEAYAWDQMSVPLGSGDEGLSSAQSKIASLRKGLLKVVTRPMGGALELVSAASQTLINSVSVQSPPSPLSLPVGVPLRNRPSTGWCSHALLKTGESVICQAPALPVLGGESLEAIIPHELLLSTRAFYLLRERRLLLALPFEEIQRLEAPPPPPSHEGPSTRRMLAVFLVPDEAARRGLPSCMQYVVRAQYAHMFTISFQRLRSKYHGVNAS